MANESIPYLCGGTFLAQVLRARLPLTTAADHINSKKECLSEQEVFRRLISIYQLKDFRLCLTWIYMEQHPLMNLTEHIGVLKKWI